jgi:hypothetical protein
MKKIIPTIIILFFTFSVKGQGYHPLVDTNKVWHQLISVWAGSMNWDLQLWLYKINDDSVYQSKNYKILWSKQDTNSQAWLVEGLIREDSTHKVYFKSNLNATEKLYYDFGMSVGDSIELPLQPGSYSKLDSIVQTPFGNGFRNKFVFYGDYDTWIEGMGSIEGLLFPFTIAYVGGGFQLLCYWENDTLKYIDNYFNDCYFGNGPYNGISDLVKNEITLSPNPTTSSITLRLPQLEGDAEVWVFNSLGEQVIKLKVCKAVTSDELRVTSEVKIDVAKLQPGLYFVKTNNFSGKFVKQN